MEGHKKYTIDFDTHKEIDQETTIKVQAILECRWLSDQIKAACLSKIRLPDCLAFDVSLVDQTVHGAEKVSRHIFATLAMLHEAYAIFVDLWLLAYPYMLVSMDLSYEAKLKRAFAKQIVVERHTGKRVDLRNFDIKYRCKLAEMLRVDVGFRHKRDDFKLRLSDINFEKAPIIFEEHYCDDHDLLDGTQDLQDTLSARSLAEWYSKSPTNRDREDVHLIILVHGYLASSFDMAFLKCQMQRLLGERVSIVCSQANDTDSSTSIAEMGKKLALDVQDTIAEYGSVIK